MILLRIIKELTIFTILLIPRVAILIFYLITINLEKVNEFLGKIFMEPFVIFDEFRKWFFQATWTASLIIFISLTYILEYFFLKDYMNSLMSHPMHLFEGNFYSLITSIFLHADILHLSTNLLALLIFGRIVEKHFKMKTLFLFIGSGIIANIISNLFAFSQNDLYYSLGASGAIAGLIMFAILLEPFAITSVFLLPIPIFIIGWFLIFLDIAGLTNPSQTNHMAHISGYSALLILFFFLEYRHKRKLVSGFIINIIMLIMFYFTLEYFNLGNFLL